MICKTSLQEAIDECPDYGTIYLWVVIFNSSKSSPVLFHLLRLMESTSELYQTKAANSYQIQILNCLSQIVSISLSFQCSLCGSGKLLIELVL